jgi:hypothetical protein
MTAVTKNLSAAQLAAAARSDEERLLYIATKLEGRYPQMAAEMRGSVETLRAVRREFELRLGDKA